MRHRYGPAFGDDRSRREEGENHLFHEDNDKVLGIDCCQYKIGSMELAHIKYFLAVCETRHFTRAALACGISQPSLSVAVRQLEKELGGALFERGPPVRLTPLGEAVKPHSYSGSASPDFSHY